MGNNTKEIFDSHLANLKIDQDLFKKFHRYTQEFIYRSEEHINFFGSNLTGTYAVRFKTTDRHAWLIDLLDVDEYPIRQEIVALPGIKDSWVRGTDVMNLSCLYLVHRIANNKNLPKSIQYEAAKDVLLALHFKLIGSLMAHYFKFPVDERIAQMVYAQMSKKFSIKQYGTWYKVLESRCDDILSASSIHKRTIERFDDDAAIQSMITDIQGRLKAMIKKIWEVLDYVRNNEQKLMSTSGHVELEGKMVMRDLLRKDTPFIRYLNEIAPDKARFVKRELVVVVGNVMQTMPEDFLVNSLERVVENMKKGDKMTTELLNETLLHAFEIFNKDRFNANKFNDIGALLVKFRALYMASRAKEPRLLQMRDDAEKLVASSIKSRNNTVIASVRTGLLLYILLRTFTMHHYE